MPNELIYQSEFSGEQMDERFTAVAQLTAALKALTTVVAQKYVKPESGIPSTDMDADVQAALAKANTAVQSLADYYTKSEVDHLLAAINGMDYVDVATLPTASASTLGKIYLVGPDGSGYYAYYYTSYDGSAYSWVGPLGTTQISLANYATKAELNQLDQEFKRSTLPLTPEWKTGYYYDTNGGLVANSGSKYTEKIDVSQYSTLLVSGTVGSSSSRRTIFYNAADEIVFTDQERLMASAEYNLANVAYVAFSFISTSAVNLSVVKEGQVYLLEQKVSDLSKDIQTLTDSAVVNYYEEVSVAANRFNVRYTVFPGSVQAVNMATGYRFALRYRDAGGNMIQDSVWSTTLLKRTPPAKAVVCDFLVEKTTGNFSADKKAEVNENLTACAIECYVKSDRRKTSEWLWQLREDYRRVSVRSIRSVAHMGYYGRSGEYGQNRAEYYINAARNGFDYGECDIKFSSDGVPVCCHDNTFTDSVSGETITISEHTWAELQEYHYHDGRLSSFEEVLFNCKISGIGLYIDHLSNVNTQEKWTTIFSILAKYQMTRRVVWLCSDYTSAVQPILAYDKFATISILSNTIDADVVSRLNALKTDYNKVVVNLNQSSAPVTDIIQYSKDLLPGVEVEVWTIDSSDAYVSYLPYVSGITSNRLSEPMVAKIAPLNP